MASSSSRTTAIVGVYVAVYSERDVDGEQRRFCNLAAFCVLEEYRAHSFRLMRAILAQRGFEFTDLSPSGNVVALNERLGFAALDTATRLVPNLPRIPRRGLTVSDDPTVVAGVLVGQDAASTSTIGTPPPLGTSWRSPGESTGTSSSAGIAASGSPIFASPLYAGGSQRRSASSVASGSLAPAVPPRRAGDPGRASSARFRAPAGNRPAHTSGEDVPKPERAGRGRRLPVQRADPPGVVGR